MKPEYSTPEEMRDWANAIMQSREPDFVIGPKVREWGFACPKGWVHWKDFTNPDNPGEIGHGCGEP